MGDRDEHGQSGASGMPRWVKVFLIVAALAALALIVSALLGLQHGPDLHAGSGGHQPLPLTWAGS